LRIVAGRWRGRRWQFPASPSIRPTPDRVRETLFNWLMTEVVGARCLDAFAGSGALGLEALSRGAASVTFIDANAQATAALRERLQQWEAQGAQVIDGDALNWLASAAVAPFDIVFLDPPFAAELTPRALCALQERSWLANPAWIYLEMPADAPPPPLPALWSTHRSGRAGEVGYYLLRREGETRA
jgi:16S rRNA (guanine966-N2)-methyltransferase